MNTAWIISFAKQVFKNLYISVFLKSPLQFFAYLSNLIFEAITFLDTIIFSLSSTYHLNGVTSIQIVSPLLYFSPFESVRVSLS